MKGWVDLVGWPCSGRFGHTRSHLSAAGLAYRKGKVRRSQTDVLPLCHATYRSVWSQRQSQWMKEAKFRTLTLPKPLINLIGDSNLSVCPPKKWICKIWWKSNRPLWICACAKNAFSCGFFVNISIYPSTHLSRCSSGLQVTFWDDFNA